jgi:hypothetical protein
MSSSEDEDGPADPWFAPGHELAAPAADPALAAVDGGQTGWFLPEGRSGLLPESMTESWDDNGLVPADRAGRVAAAGAPPWGRDSASGTAEEPPPWENGPWPGPGEPAVSRQRPGTADRSAADTSASGPEPGPERRRSRLIMVGGAAALVLIAVIVVIVVATSGGSAAGCATYPAPVRQAYSRAMSDLSGHAAASVLGTDLGRAASLANAAAAADSQITARTALFAMASDLDAAYADVAHGRPVASDLQQRLVADGTALPQSC